MSIDEAPETEPAIAPSPPQRDASWTLIAIGSLALAVIAVTFLAVVIVKVSSQSSTIANRNQGATANSLTGPTAQAAKAAAVRETAATLTYDYKTLQADVAKAQVGMTPGFRTTYEQFVAREVTPVATKYKATTTGQVVDSGVISVTPTTATVLVFANQTVTNTLLTTSARLDRTRIKVSMVLQNGKWLISALNPI